MLITHGESPALVAAQIACCAGAGGTDYRRAGGSGNHDGGGNNDGGGILGHPHHHRMQQQPVSTATTPTAPTPVASIDVREHLQPYEAPVPVVPVVAVVAGAMDLEARPSSAVMEVDQAVAVAVVGGERVSGDSSGRNSSAGAGDGADGRTGRNKSRTNTGTGSSSSSGGRGHNSSTSGSELASPAAAPPSSAIVISPLVSYMDHRAPQIETTFVQLQVHSTYRPTSE